MSFETVTIEFAIKFYSRMVVLLSFYLKVENFHIFSRETLSARGMRDVRRIVLYFRTLVALVPVNNHWKFQINWI